VSGGHTPGSWLARRAALPDNTGGYDWAIISPDKAIVAECFEVVDWAEEGVTFRSEPAERNARLISAAPDLLEACEDALATGLLEHGGLADALRAAIAKATET